MLGKNSDEKKLVDIHRNFEFFHHRQNSSVTIPEFCRILDAYLRCCSE